MGTKGRTSTDSDLAERVALLEDALHKTRQRCDVLMCAIGELARMHVGRGLTQDETVETLALRGAAANMWIASYGSVLLEPDHAEASEPQPGATAPTKGQQPATSDLVRRVRLAGARYAFTGEDPLADLREEVA